MKLKRRIILTIILVALFLLIVFLVDNYNFNVDKEFRGTFVEYEIEGGDLG